MKHDNGILWELQRKIVSNLFSSSHIEVFRYKHAYDSMKACPIVWNHPNEAQALKGLGPKLCARLTDRLREHCTDNGLPMPTLSRKSGLVLGHHIRKC